MNNNKIDLLAIFNEVNVIFGFAEWMGQKASNLHCMDDIFRLQEAAQTYDWLVDLVMTVPNPENNHTEKIQKHREDADQFDKPNNGVSEEMAHALIKIYKAWEMGIL